MGTDVLNFLLGSASYSLFPVSTDIYAQTVWQQSYAASTNWSVCQIDLSE
jgi:hypothetical protein